MRKTDQDMELEILMPFVDESKSFTHGFECGQIWEWAQNGKVFDNYLFHSKNKIQVNRILKIYSYDFRIELIDTLWSSIFGTNNAELN